MEWLKKQGMKVKVALGVVASVFSFILLIFFKSKLNAKSKLNYELDRVKRETEMANFEEDYDIKQKKLSKLKQQEKDIRKKIKEVEEREYKGEEVSTQEIDDFFEKRGLM